MPQVTRFGDHVRLELHPLDSRGVCRRSCGCGPLCRWCRPAWGPGISVFVIQL